MTTPADTNATVLVVDDTVVNLQVLESILVKGGYVVRSALSGPTALKSAFSHPPDLVLLDMRLPEMDGAEICRNLKANNSTRNVPVIFISAFDSLEDKIQAFKEGGVDYINWPFQVDEVLARVTTHLAIARVQAELQRSNTELQHAIRIRREAEDTAQKVNQELALRQQELDAANQELEAFSYSVAHDLRAPLRAIDGFTNDLIGHRATLASDTVVALQRIQTQTARMTLMIDDLLRLAQVRTTDLQRQHIDLSAMAHEVIQTLKQAELQPGRKVSVSIEPNMSAYADPGLTLSILLNLLGNAWKFTSKRQPAEIHFGTETIDGVLTYVVRDNGAGFDQTASDHLFKPFQRLHAAEEFPGIGIGLAIVERIIKRHGAKIWGDSTPGQGARFCFTLSRNDHG